MKSCSTILCISVILAILGGQVDAASSGLVFKEYSYGSLCATEVTVFANLGAAMSDNANLEISMNGLTTEKSAFSDLIDTNKMRCDGSSSGSSTAFDAGSVDKANGVTTYTLTAGAGACATSVELTFKNLCDNGITDFSGEVLKLKINNVGDDAGTWVPSTQEKDAGPGPKQLANFKVLEMPLTAATTSAFTVSFTGKAEYNGKQFLFRLPSGYTVSADSCELRTDNSATGHGYSKSLGSLTSPCSFNSGCGVGVIASLGQNVFVDGKTTTFTCDKVTSGSQIAESKADNVFIGIGTYHKEHVIFHTVEQPPLPKPPTPYSAAHVSAASGVVVGALGAAALFMSKY